MKKLIIYLILGFVLINFISAVSVYQETSTNPEDVLITGAVQQDFPSGIAIGIHIKNNDSNWLTRRTYMKINLTIPNLNVTNVNISMAVKTQFVTGIEAVVMNTDDFNMTYFNGTQISWNNQPCGIYWNVSEFCNFSAGFNDGNEHLSSIPINQSTFIPIPSNVYYDYYGDKIISLAWRSTAEAGTGTADPRNEFWGTEPEAPDNLKPRINFGYMCDIIYEQIIGDWSECLENSTRIRSSYYNDITCETGIINITSEEENCVRGYTQTYSSIEIVEVVIDNIVGLGVAFFGLIMLIAFILVYKFLKKSGFKLF